MKKIFIITVLIALVFILPQVSAESTVCCERTLQGALCQNVPANQCDPSSQQVPTSCESTSFCKPGTCYDSTEGTCADNTPQLVCNNNGGIWSAETPPQCELGCCILGDQAAFVSLVRCKRLSSFLGLETNYDKSIVNEFQCINAVQAQDRGACVFEAEFEKTCTFGTRSECDSFGESNATSVTFYKDKLCSAEELGTNCGPSEQTICSPGKDEVYFVDTCGNVANIYDSSKIDDQDYWTNIKSKEESCGFGKDNAGSSSCGNCNYLAGSYCRAENTENGRASFGDFICADLNCVDEKGEDRLHGESWCVADPKSGEGQDAVGSRFYRELCINGDVVSEACDDLRAEECVEDVIDTDLGPFSQAACRVNRWQDCLAQTDEDDCLNNDRRDCFWKKGVTLGNNSIGGVCLPSTSPGLNFWNSEETRAICSQGNKVCIVTYEKGLFGGEKCVENCDCLTDQWSSKYGEVCSALGDCGPGSNYIGDQGYKKGYEITINGQKQK